MADETPAPVTPSMAPPESAATAALAPIAPTESAPVAASTPSVASADNGAQVAETPAAATTEIPAAESAKPAETPVEDVLGAEKSKEGEVKSESKPEEKKDVKPEGERAEVPTVVELPKYDEFKIPEGVKIDKEPLDTFAKILGKIETSKLDHTGIQAIGQELVDLATKGTMDSINRLNDSYVQIHKDNIAKRVSALKADPIMGGENFQKTVSELQDSVEQYGGTTEQIATFRKEISEAGLGPSPAVCRLIYNMQKKIDTYTKEGSENRIVPGVKPAPERVKPYQLFYTG